MRTYEKTHPWLKFEINLERASPRLWIGLGEWQSKCEHISGVPLKREAGQRLHSIYLAKGVHATTAIEGNTLAEEEVQRQLEGKLEVPPSRQYLKQETQNIIDECNRVASRIESGEALVLTPARIKEINRAVLKDLPLEGHVVPGEIPEVSIVVARYRGAPRQDCEYLLERLSSWLEGPTFAAPPGLEIVYAVIKAVMTHLYLAWIHPFGDGNGRTARMIEFEILLSSGVPAPAAHLLSNHYNLTRSEYYRQLDRASASGGEVLPFIEYAVQGLVDGLREQLKVIQSQQLEIAWRDFVYEEFRMIKGPVPERRRALLLELSSLPQPAAASELLTLSPSLAAAYAAKTLKTLTRDLDELIRMGLARKQDDKFAACREVILAFLPVRLKGPSACSPGNKKSRPS